MCGILYCSSGISTIGGLLGMLSMFSVPQPKVFSSWGTSDSLLCKCVSPDDDSSCNAGQYTPQTALNAHRYGEDAREGHSAQKKVPNNTGGHCRRDHAERYLPSCSCVLLGEDVLPREVHEGNGVGVFRQLVAKGVDATSSTIESRLIIYCPSSENPQTGLRHTGNITSTILMVRKLLSMEEIQVGTYFVFSHREYNAGRATPTLGICRCPPRPNKDLLAHARSRTELLLSAGQSLRPLYGANIGCPLP